MRISLYYKDQLIKASISKDVIKDPQKTVKWFLDQIIKSKDNDFFNSIYLIGPNGENVDITKPLSFLNEYESKGESSFYLGINKKENNTKVKEINFHKMIDLIKEATNGKKPIKITNSSTKPIKNALLKCKQNLAEIEKINEEHLKFLKEIYENGFSLQYNEGFLTQLIEMGFNEIYIRIALRMNRNALSETILSLTSNEDEIWEQHIILSLPNSDVARYQKLDLARLFKDCYEYEFSFESEGENEGDEEENEYVDDSNNNAFIPFSENYFFSRGLNMNIIFQGIGNLESNSEPMEDEIDIGFSPEMLENNSVSSLSNSNADNEENNSDMNISENS